MLLGLFLFVCFFIFLLFSLLLFILFALLFWEVLLYTQSYRLNLYFANMFPSVVFVPFGVSVVSLPFHRAVSSLILRGRGLFGGWFSFLSCFGDYF